MDIKLKSIPAEANQQLPGTGAVVIAGTLYRMRFPFTMIFVSIGIAGILQLVKIRPPWVENSDSNRD